MNIQRRHLIYFLIAMVDLAMILCSYFLSSYMYLGDPLVPNQLVNVRILGLPDTGLIFLIAYSILLVIGYAAAKVFGNIYHGYIRRMVKSVICVNLIGLFLFMSSIYVFDLDDASRILVFLFFIFSTLFVCLVNWGAIHVFRIRRNSQKYRRNVLVIGSGHLAREYAKAVGTRSSRLEHVIGYIDPAIGQYGYMWPGQQAYSYNASNMQGEEDSADEQKKDYLGDCLGSVYDLERIFSEQTIDELVLALDVENYSCVRLVTAAADRHGSALTLVPFYNDIIPRSPNIDSFGGVNVVDLRSMPLSNPIYSALKRAMDIVVSLIVIVLTSWLMIITAIGVKASSPGPVFFKQTRMGKNNKTFDMLKFRSMKVNDDSDVAWSTNDDPRKTRFGSFIRKYSIDELPQFFNVLVGDMSIVGPRPEVPFYVQQFSANVPLYMLRHQVRPGITGLAQISGFRGDTSIDKRIECDIYYIQHWSFWMDVKIFFKTLFGGYANDEVIAESSFHSKFAGTSFYKACTAIHESAIEGALAKTFNFVYLALAFLYVYFTIYVNPVQEVISGISTSLGYAICTSIPYALIAIGVIMWICEARKLSFWITAICVGVLFYFVIRASGYVQLWTMFAFVFAYPKTLKIDFAAGIVFLASVLGILTLVAASVGGVIPDNTGMRGESPRHSMGFVSPNAFATAVTACLIPYVYFRLHDWKWLDAVLCLFVGALTYIVAQGRMSLAMLLFLVVLACICRFKGVKGFLKSIAPWVIPVCFCVSVLFYYMYMHGIETAFSNGVNWLFSGRPEYIASFLSEYKITLFGQPVKTIGMSQVLADPTLSWRGIDSSYMNILLRFGVVGSILLIAPTIWLGKKAGAKGYTSAIFIICIIAMFSLTENFYYNLSQNFGIFIMGYFITSWATKKDVSPERASAPIDRSIDWVNMKGSRWRDFLNEK